MVPADPAVPSRRVALLCLDMRAAPPTIRLASRHRTHAITYPVAVISDIHANLEALETVLSSIDEQGIARVVCLGDIIGYGPNPRECLERVMSRCEWSLLGNHDFAAIYEPTNFNVGAEASAFWSRRQLELDGDRDRRGKRWEFLCSLNFRQHLDGTLCVHGSPRRPINEYVFADDTVTAPTKMRQIFQRIDHTCLVGHTHVQGLFSDAPEFYAPDELGRRYTFTGQEKTLINVGSVGQPRDRDPRSGYAILHEDRIDFFRLEYDAQPTIDKIRRIPELPDFFGDRLLEGR